MYKIGKNSQIITIKNDGVFSNKFIFFLKSPDIILKM